MWGISASSDALGLELLDRLAEGQRLGLGEDVRNQQVLVVAERIQRVVEADEVARDQLGSLMDQLVEGMLAVGSGFAPEDRSGRRNRPGSPSRVTLLPFDSMVSCWR